MRLEVSTIKTDKKIHYWITGITLVGGGYFIGSGMEEVAINGASIMPLVMVVAGVVMVIIGFINLKKTV